LAAATRRANIGFDLAILDEAHKTVGVRSKTFATLLRERKFKAQRRLFMTATERVFRGDSDEVLSMDNEADYGKCFFQLSYKEAIAQRIISDYKILTMTVSNERVAKVIKENRILNLRLRDLDEAEARAVATGVALKRVEKQGVTHAISFHSSIRAAERFRDQQDVLNRLRPRTTNLHISSKKTAGERADLLREFVGESRALMTNARCLTEGVDVPAIDCVVFADPKQSRIDIVQAAGRALRRYPGKDYGHILLPLVVPREMGFNEFAETTAFRQVARIVTALSTQDERIADEFRAVLHDRTSSGKIVEVCGDVPLGMHMSLGQFAKAISSRVWNSVGRANWRKFEDARAFVRSLKLEGQLDWAAYCSSGNKPADIPAAPEAVYANVWMNWGNWLGTGRYSGAMRSFEDARAFARKLKLKSASQWHAYCGSGKKPKDLPRNPSQAYAKSGWISWGDWLGHDRFYRGKMRPFKKARAFVRDLGLKSQKEWFTYCHSGKKPEDIPQSPWTVYPDEWIDLFDWLGGGQARRNRKAFRPFKAARTFVRRLRLKNFKEWCAYCDSGKKPIDIPKIPSGPYANDGWIDWADWLGSKHIQPRGKWRPFKEARAFVRRLGLRSAQEWRAYCRSGARPYDIPADPQRPYTKSGWVSWNDWLGTDA